MENENYLNHLTMVGYEDDKTFDESVFDKERIDEIREVIRKFFRKRESPNPEASSQAIKRCLDAYLGGERIHKGKVQGKVTNGEVIYAMCLEGFEPQRTLTKGARFNVVCADLRALSAESFYDPATVEYLAVRGTIERIAEIEPEHSGWYRYFDRSIVRVGGFENYALQEKAEQKKSGESVEVKPGGNPKTSRKMDSKLVLRLLLFILSVCMCAFSIIFFVHIRHRTTMDAVPVRYELIPEPEDDSLFTVKDSLYSELAENPFNCYVGGDSYWDQVDTCDLMPSDDWSYTPAPPYYRGFVDFTRSLSWRDYATMVLALLFAAGFIFWLTILFKRVRVKNRIEVPKNPEPEAMPKPDSVALFRNTFSQRNVIVYGDEQYLNNVLTMMDACSVGKKEVLYFNPSDLNASSPLPFLRGDMIRTYGDAFRLAEVIYDVVRPVHHFMMASEFYYTSSKTMLAEAIWQLSRWDAGRLCTFPHLVELCLSDTRSYMRHMLRLPDVSKRYRYIGDLVENKIKDQFIAQTSEMQMTMSRFCTPEMYLACRDAKIDDTDGIVLLVRNDSPNTLAQFQPVLDIIARGYLDSSHVPFAVLPEIDFSRMDVRIGNASLRRCSSVKLDGLYRGYRTAFQTGYVDIYSHRDKIEADIIRLLISGEPDPFSDEDFRMRK